MTSTIFTEYVQDFREDQVLHELIPPATPNKNAHVEAFNSILEIEFVQPRYFMTYGQTYRETVDFIDFYNSFRLHGSLKNRTPMELYESYQRGEALNIQEIRI
jgi:putative transposase